MGNFVRIPEKEVWQLYGAPAGREGINVYPTALPTEWWTMRGCAVYGLATLKRGGQRLRGVWVPPSQRGKGFGPACVRDAMERVAILDTLDYAPEPYLSLGWTLKSERAGIYTLEWRRP